MGAEFGRDDDGSAGKEGREEAADEAVDLPARARARG